jgi:hypothetical protein
MAAITVSDTPSTAARRTDASSRANPNALLMARTYPASGQDASRSAAANLASGVKPAILSPSAQTSCEVVLDTLSGLHDDVRQP